MTFLQFLLSFICFDATTTHTGSLLPKMATVRMNFTVLILLLHVCKQAVLGDTLQANGCGKDPFVGPGLTERRYIDVNDPTFGTITRSYRLLLPLNYDPNTPHMLLFDHHGLYMNARQEEQGSNIDILSGYGVILVWPNGSNDSETGVRNWYVHNHNRMYLRDRSATSMTGMQLVCPQPKDQWVILAIVIG